MKKLIPVILVIVLILSVAPACLAANTDTLADWNIRIVVPDGKTAVLKGTEYYIYEQNEGSIPYVMLTPYGKYDSGEKFLSDFTEYMMKQHEDLTVVTDPVQRTIGDKDCWETAYKYDVSGNEVVDRRIVTIRNNAAYLFTSKECKELNMMVDNMLEEVITNAEFIP